VLCFVVQGVWTRVGNRSGRPTFLIPNRPEFHVVDSTALYPTVFEADLTGLYPTMFGTDLAGLYPMEAGIDNH